MELLFTIIGFVITLLGIGVAYLEYKLHKKEVVEDETIKPITSAKGFYDAVQEIQETFSRVRIVSRTPGIIFPSEKKLTPFRVKYFETIEKRLSQIGDYHLDYLFDLKRFREEILRLYNSDRDDLLEKIRENIRIVTSHSNLDLRTTNTEPLTSMVMGGESRVAIGLGEKKLKHLVEGMMIHSKEVLRIFLQQYESVFEKAIPVTSDEIVDMVLNGELQ